ncbi:unnamed protein product [Prorocentrum cordatum]|uniref:Uncharacterized protein n=1 Tax=Prorocentrum cordatum TaxID=2364126 RepID=A0ABN9TJK2_9DINO|nr:unnamed protein product [Polarella glacialis]
MRLAARWRAQPLREPLAAGGCAAGGEAAAEGLSVVVLSSGQSLDGPPPRLLLLGPRVTERGRSRPMP